MSDEPLPVQHIRPLLEELIATAGWAPFHRPCHAVHQEVGRLNGIEPWRMYALDSAACRELRLRLPTENAGKIPALLAAATALIQVTWLPNPSNNVISEAQQLFEPTLENMEHIAAASAAIQNLLLAASAHEFYSYWSSGGGLLRSSEICGWLNIPSEEILLGSIFLFADVKRETGNKPILVGSKLRVRRTQSENWMRWVSL